MSMPEVRFGGAVDERCKLDMSVDSPDVGV
jgi:hypothetical protein